jgi:hypothetical protein
LMSFILLFHLESAELESEIRLETCPNTYAVQIGRCQKIKVGELNTVEDGKV